MNCPIPFRTNKSVSIYFMWLLVLMAAVGSLTAQAPLPALTGKLVSDYADMLNPAEEQALEQKLLAYNDSTSTQIAIVTETDLQGDDVFNRSYQIAEQWGIGREGKNNGVLIYISKNDRKIYIQTGYGVEGFLTDAMSKRIIETLIKPAFKAGEYYTGLDNAVERIIALGQGEYQADPNDLNGTSDGSLILLIFLIFFFLMLYFSYKARQGHNRGYYRRGSYEYEDPNAPRRHTPGGGWVIWGGGGFGNDDHWGSGGGGGGGFGGFGGGSFGGGGAGGDW